MSRRQGLLLLFPLLALVSLCVMAGSGILVTRAEPHTANDQLLLDVNVEYNFSPKALEALDNGVPLTLEAHIRIRREGAWIWEENLLDKRQLMLIRYQPLSRLYQVVRLPHGPKQSFVTRRAAISALGDMDGLQLLAHEKLDAEDAYKLQIKVSLDIEALPLPLRPMAYLTSDWDLSSGWTHWPLQP